MSAVVVTMMVLLVLVVVAWMVLTSNHPENAADHVEIRVPLPEEAKQQTRRIPVQKGG